jgi:hypothetical protein
MLIAELIGLVEATVVLILVAIDLIEGMEVLLGCIVLFIVGAVVSGAVTELDGADSP